MQIEAFLADIQDLCCSSEETNNTSKEAQEKCLKQSRLTAMMSVCQFCLLKTNHANRSIFG